MRTQAERTSGNHHAGCCRPGTFDGPQAAILRELGVGKMRLLGSARKMPSMAGFGLEICGHLAAGEL